MQTTYKSYLLSVFIFKEKKSKDILLELSYSNNDIRAVVPNSVNEMIYNGFTASQTFYSGYDKRR